MTAGQTVRWLLVREAKIDPRYRQRFEELGAEIVRAYFTEPIGTIVWTDDQGVTTLREAHEPMQLWLREQFDRAERKETWLLTMEVAITIFVAAELVMSILDFYCRSSK